MLSPNKREVNKRFIIRSIGLAVILIRYYNTSVACSIYIAACLVMHELVITCIGVHAVRALVEAGAASMAAAMQVDTAGSAGW
jgi:hypothetical protein